MAAYKSLHKNLPYLFTYKNRSNLQIPNTTNSLVGGVFTQLKKLIKLHQGMSRSLKMKLIDDLGACFFITSQKQKFSEIRSVSCSGIVADTEI